jgi:hypothetical protein
MKRASKRYGLQRSPKGKVRNVRCTKSTTIEVSEGVEVKCEGERHPTCRRHRSSIRQFDMQPGTVRYKGTYIHIIHMYLCLTLNYLAISAIILYG